jgi:hypothetical protein
MADKKFYGYQGHAGHRRSGERSDGLFGWTLLIFLLIGLVFLCWMGSYYIFARPEQAANYRLLQRLHKLEAPQRFEITAAPRGEFLKPNQLLERFGEMMPSEIRRSNETLLRSFIRNYRQNRDLVPYAVGTYRVIGTLPLSKDTFCTSGVVALLQAVEQPEILLEQLFTANEKNLPALNRALQPGQEIKLEKPLDLSAIVHIDRLPDNRIKLTTMPLLYGSYGSGQGPASFSLEPPTELNVEAGLPAIKTDEIAQLSGGKLAIAKTGKHLTRIKEADPTPTPTTSVAHAIPVQTPIPVSTPMPSPEPSVARAIPVNATAVLPALPVETPAPTPIPTPEPTPILVVSSPKPTPTPIVAATPKPSPSPIAPTAVAMTNSLASTTTNAAAAIATPGETTWPLYAPGKMPRGALLDPAESGELVGRGTPHERHYLRGHFSVTASGNGKAVLRPQSGLAGLPLGPSSKVRVIVEYPVGEEPPVEGHIISRDGLRPFQIISVKRGDDGMLNVYAREVTRGE